MKRRAFLKNTGLGAAGIGMGFSGCSGKGGMLYRILGKTGIKVSLLGFGSHLTEENKENPEGRDRQIQEAIDRGVNLFDIYEHGYEQFEPMAKSLSKHSRDKTIISLVSVEKDSKREVEGALKTFKTDYIDLYRAVNTIPESTDPLFEFKEQGKIRAVGFVAHYEEHALKGIEQYDFDYVMLPYNFHHNWGGPSALGTTYDLLMPILKKRNMGLIAMKPLATHHMLKLASELKMMREDLEGTPVIPAMLRYVFENPAVHNTLPTMNSVEELLENYSAIEHPELDKENREVLKRLSKAAHETLGAYLSPQYRFLERWTA